MAFTRNIIVNANLQGHIPGGDAALFMFFDPHSVWNLEPHYPTIWKSVKLPIAGGTFSIRGTYTELLGVSHAHINDDSSIVEVGASRAIEAGQETKLELTPFETEEFTTPTDGFRPDTDFGVENCLPVDESDPDPVNIGVGFYQTPTPGDHDKPFAAIVFADAEFISVRFTPILLIYVCYGDCPENIVIKRLPRLHSCLWRRDLRQLTEDANLYLTYDDATWQYVISDTPPE